MINEKLNEYTITSSFTSIKDIALSLDTLSDYELVIASYAIIYRIGQIQGILGDTSQYHSSSDLKEILRILGA